MPSSKTPAELIEELRERFGSDDKLAAAINEQFRTRLTRQTIIRWRQGKGISRAWAERLAVFTGLDPEDFRGWSPAQREAQRRLEDRVATLEVWRSKVDALLAARRRSTS